MAENPTPAEKRGMDEPTAPVTTRHALTLSTGETLRYTVTAGYLPLRNEKSGEVEARVFFVAYNLTDGGGRGPKGADRPLTFTFNGGPGSSSVWLHLGALGPKRVPMLGEDGHMPPPPYRVVDNEHTWLPYTDLVFIDPVGTGYSRAASDELGKRFWSLKGDVESVGEFIRLYLSRYERWASPLYLAGESYGTTRAAGLAGHLIEKGIAFSGILLISSILNFQTARFTRGNDLPYLLFLPTYTATAFYHAKLPGDYQKDLRRTLDEVEQFASTEYLVALAQGDGLTQTERRGVVSKLARYTGLSETFVEQSDLRIEIMRFCKELLRAEGKTVGRLDSRLTGRGDLPQSGERFEFDPAMAAIRPPYTAAFNQYVRTSLGFRTDDTYHILGGGFSGWDWNSDNVYADTGEALRQAFAKNPHLRVFVGSGYYDLATPYFATEYTLSHLGLPPEARERVTTAEYEAGHMMYIHTPSLALLTDNVRAFLSGVDSP
jgi:carboxypeptidase C (cathepsin A)